MESDSSHSLVSRQFSNQYVWLRYKKNKNLRWNIYNTEMFKKEAVGLEQMFFKLINSKTLKFRKRKKLWEKGQDWKHYHKIYGRNNDKTIKCFIKLLIYIERKENLVEESHQDYDEDYDYSLDEASDCDDEHHEDNDEKDEDEIDSDNDHDGYKSNGKEYEDLVHDDDVEDYDDRYQDSDSLQEKTDDDLKSNDDSTYGDDDYEDYDEDYDYSLDEASDCDDEHHEDNDEKDEDEIDSDNDHDGYQSHGEEYEDLMARVDLLREKMKMSMVVYVDSPQDFKMQPPSLEDILESTSGKILITDGSSRETSQSEGVKDSSNYVYNNHNEDYFKLNVVTYDGEKLNNDKSVMAGVHLPREIKTLAMYEPGSPQGCIKRYSCPDMFDIVKKDCCNDQKSLYKNDTLKSPDDRNWGGASEIPLKKKTVLNEKRDGVNANENPANGGEVDKVQVEAMKSKNINKDQKDESLKKNNKNLDYGPTLDGGGISVLPPPPGCVDSVKNTSVALNLGEQVQVDYENETGDNLDIDYLFKHDNKNNVNMIIDTDEEYPVKYVTQTETSVDLPLDSMVAVPEDLYISGVKGGTESKHALVKVCEENNMKENNSVKEINAYSGIVCEVQANDSHEVPLAQAAVVSGDCLLFVVTDVLAVRCTAQITWDPGGEPVLRRNMRKLDR